MDPKNVKAEVKLEVEELEERIAPGGLTTAAAASGNAVPPDAAAFGIGTANTAGATVPPAAAV